MEESHCKEWKNNPTKNPLTGRQISPGKKIYNRFLHECGSPKVGSPSKRSPKVGSPSKQSERDICLKWIEEGTPPRNPFTHRPLKQDGEVYRKLQKKCNAYNRISSKSPEHIRRSRSSDPQEIVHIPLLKSLERSDFVIGQMPTGSLKKIVVFTPDDPRYVYKGPYDVNEVRYKNVFERSTQFKKWKTPLVVHPLISYELSELLQGYPSKYNRVIVFPNILGRFPSSSEVRTNKLGVSFRISTDRGLRKLRDIITEKPYLFNADVLEALADMCVLRVGDMGLYNILVGEDDSVYVIDYEDNSTKQDIVFFSKPPAKELHIHTYYQKYAAEVIRRMQQKTYDDTLYPRL